MLLRQLRQRRAASSETCATYDADPTDPAPPMRSLMRSLRPHDGRHDSSRTFQPSHGLDAHTLLACLEAAGYPINASAYEVVEAGLRLPPDPLKFILAVARCLHLDEQTRAALAQTLARDAVRLELGDDLTTIVFVP
jgi:hypothetical protein